MSPDEQMTRDMELAHNARAAALEEAARTAETCAAAFVLYGDHAVVQEQDERTRIYIATAIRRLKS